MRILLINPPSPEQLGAPLLGLQYLAASLLQAGCEVRVIDAAARHFHHDGDWIVDQAVDFAPRIIGFSLFTRWVWHAYRLAHRLADEGDWLMLAGGAHATVRAEETLRHGFDLALGGEAEQSMVQLVTALQQEQDIATVPGLVWRLDDGHFKHGPPPLAIEDLDELATPELAQELFDPAGYDPNGNTTTPGGILTSRGCPARCTFCANYVTGRRFRHHSSARIVAQMRHSKQRWGIEYFPFWDDALTANQSRLRELCRAMVDELDFQPGFSAITRANMVNPTLLAEMSAAGLTHVNFGVESGDDRILRAIRKGILTEHVVQALEWSKEAGLTTASNFMLGFPQETPEALDNTLRFMERIAPLVDTFSTLGVVVPFPGTPIYEDFHQRYGFTDWWLRESHSYYDAPPPMDDFDRFYRHYIDDANLELDFFAYSEAMKDMIRTCLRYKAEHNLARMGLLQDPVYHPAQSA